MVMPQSTFVSKIIHKNISISNYTGASKPVDCTCNVCGFKWTPTAKALIDYKVRKGNGCPSCVRRGFDKSKPGILYMIKFTHPSLQKSVIKIGITNKNTKDRIKGMGVSKDVSFEIMNEIRYKNGADAWRTERETLKLMAPLSYKEGVEIIQNGHTELFYVA